MAELADAHGSGPCEGYFMGVRIPLSAPTDLQSGYLVPGLFYYNEMHFRVRHRYHKKYYLSCFSVISIE